VEAKGSTSDPDSNNNYGYKCGTSGQKVPSTERLTCVTQPLRNLCPPVIWKLILRYQIEFISYKIIKGNANKVGI
jgi:hypothetical protein